MANPKVSIIITYFNIDLYIEDSIQSALNQTYKNIEIILINDGSNKDSAILKFQELKNKYSNNILILEQSNQGVAAARNNAIKQSNGEYIVCLDGDDILEPSYVEEAVKVFVNSSSNVGIVTSWVQLFGNNNSTWQCPPFDKNRDYVRILVENPFHISSMFRRSDFEKIGGFDVNAPGYEDWIFWISLSSLKIEWKVIESFLIKYRRTEDTRVISDHKKRETIINYIANKFEKLYEANAKEIFIMQDSRVMGVIEMLENANKNYEATISELNNRINDLTQKKLKKVKHKVYNQIKRILRNK